MNSSSTHIRLFAKYARIALAVVLALGINTQKLQAGNGLAAVSTVVIDAGHGGHDAGCSGAHSKEKHIALDIALKLGDYIEDKIPGVKVIYTRKTDVFVELHERAAIANRANADVFISIHCNANGSHSPYGTETYVMGLHKNEANLNVAKRENKVVMLEDDYNHHYDGFDPKSPTAHIIFTLYQNAHLVQSIDLAGKIEQQFEDRVGRKSRGVKQAGFLVLYKTTMPSVLVETGFLTNYKEEDFLDSEYGKDMMASALFRAFRDYKVEMDERQQNRQNDAPTAQLPAPEAEKTEELALPEPTESEADALKDQDYSHPDATAQKAATIESREIRSPEASTQQIYRVQVLASIRKYKASDPLFRNLEKSLDLYTIKDATGIYKYMVGEFSNPGDAAALKDKLRNTDFPDAFVISQAASELAKK